MMKRVVAVSLSLLMFGGLMAQRAQETNVNIGDMKAPAFTLSLNKDLKVVQDAVKQRVKESGWKTKNVDGYTAATSQLVSEIASVPVNVYVRVDEQGKKKDRQTVLTVSVISTDLTYDQDALKNNVARYVESFVPYIDKYEAMLSMQAEQKNLDKAKKAQSQAASVVTGLEKSINSDRDKIESKKREIENLNKKIADCQNEIQRLEASISENTGKKTDAEQKLQEAQQNVQNVEREVERYRSLSK